MVLTNKPHCILHIGMHKTGSSSIQETLGECASNLQFEYIKPCKANNLSQFIYTLFSDTPETYHTNRKQGLTKLQISDINQRNIKQLTTLLEKTLSETVIISAEDMVFLKENELQKLKEYLTQYCKSIQIIGYVRPPVAYMQSAMQQLIKDGMGSFILDNFYPSYRDKFDKFDKVFGINNVKLLKYDVSNLLKGNVVLDFCSHIDISVDSDSIYRANDSISLEAVSLLYAYRKFGSGFGAIGENQLLIKKISGIGNKTISFSAKAVEPILKKNSDDIQWMENRLGCSLNEAINNSEVSISSEDDLLAFSTEYATDLQQLLFEQIQQQPVTAQKVADWMQLLRQQLSNAKSIQAQNYTVFSAAQIERLKAKNLQLNDILKDLALSLGRAGHKEAAMNLSEKLMLLTQGEEKAIHNREVQIAFSIGLYKNGYMMGWILDKSNPCHRLSIELRCIHGVIGKGVADKFRQDLANGEFGDGHCAFRIKVDSEFKNFGEKITIRVIDYNKDFYVATSAIRVIN